jgi:hypothetical protein
MYVQNKRSQDLAKGKINVNEGQNSGKYRERRKIMIIAGVIKHY